MNVVQPSAVDVPPHPLYFGIDARRGRRLSLESQSHKVQGDLDLLRTGPAGQLEELVDRFGKTLTLG